MATITLSGIKSGAFDPSFPEKNFHSSTTVQYESGEYLCIQYEALPENLKYKKIISVTARYYVANSIRSDLVQRIYWGPLPALIDPEAITYADGGRGLVAEANSRITVYRSDIPLYVEETEDYTGYKDPQGAILEILNNGTIVDTNIGPVVATTRHSQRPQLRIEYDANDVDLSVSDMSAYNRWGVGAPSVIRWIASPSTIATYTLVKQQSAKVQWRIKGDTSVHEIDIEAGAANENNAAEITVPAGTFPAGDIMWRVSGTATSGVAFTSDWFEHKVWDVAIRSASPASGYVPKTRANTFTWALGQLYGDGDYQYTPLTQKTATFRWRTAAGAAVNEIACEDKSSVTIPAGTFTTNQIQWQVSAATEEGVSATSEWMTLSTAEAASTASPISPKGEVVDAASLTVFSWSHTISTGTAQTKADLQISADQQTWTDLATVTGADQTYTAPANTLGSGTKFWRVRTYNTDGVASEWSDAAEFICVGAPEAPAVMVQSQSPRPAVSWQSAAQLAYQVEIDGVYTSGTYYGTDKQWTAPLYLADGTYTIRVRVQNEYALWSPWGAAAVQIVNTPGSAITLDVSTDTAARLAWSTTGAYDYYLIYRDGQLVAKTTGASYVDSMAIGAVSYQVRGCFASSGNYGLSDEVSAVISVDCVTVSDLDTGAVLPLPYSDSAHRATSRQTMRSVQLVQLSGRRYPVAERSEAYSDSIDVACLFYRSEDCAALEALVGHMVNVKTPEGWMVSGCLSGLSSRADGGFFTTYTFTVTQTDMEEVIDIDA